MASINLGTFYDGFCGGNYTCYLIYDNPSRSGDNVTITNVKIQIVSQQSWGTEGRIGARLYIPGGTIRADNTTVAASYTYPTNVTVTLASSITFSNLTTSFSFAIAVSDTGYGTSWNSNYSKTFSGNISCPARTYSVSYNANGGSGAPGAQTKTYNVALTLSSTIPTRSGYTFTKWNTNSGGTGTDYSPGGSYTGNAALTLYAQWTENVATYPVTYDANGATSGTAPASQTKTNGVSLTLQTNTGALARAGYALNGWNTSSAGTGTHYALGGTYTGNAALALYAEWIKLKTIYVWDGSAWKEAIPWIWNGSTWKRAVQWTWDGSTWK